jgi:hypothetical protein
MESTRVEGEPSSRPISLDGGVLLDALRQASACSEVSLLGIAEGEHLSLVALSAASFIISWRVCLSAAAERRLVFLVPPMIIRHLLAALPEIEDAVELVLDGSEAGLTTRDGVGRYELRWRFDLRGFPAPPAVGRLVAIPSALVPLEYLHLADSIHQAVSDLGMIESQQSIHRSKLAIRIGLSNGNVAVGATEICTEAASQYFFDPRMLIRALECIRADQVWVGLSRVDEEQGFLSLVDHQPSCTTHCALLSVSLNSPWLVPLPLRQEPKSTPPRAAVWRI